MSGPGVAETTRTRDRNLTKAGTMPEQYPIPGFSRNVLIREDDGSWTVIGVRGKPMAGGRSTYDSRRRYFNLTADSGKATGIQLGRIVLLALVGEPPPGTECCHNDGNPANNDPDNLRWDSHQENILDCVKHATHPALKLTAEDAKAIRNEWIRGLKPINQPGGTPGSQRWLATKYGVDHGTISRIISGTSRLPNEDVD